MQAVDVTHFRQRRAAVGEARREEARGVMGTHLRSSPGRKGAQGSISPRLTGFQGLNVSLPIT